MMSTLNFNSLKKQDIYVLEFQRAIESINNTVEVDTNLGVFVNSTTRAALLLPSDFEFKLITENVFVLPQTGNNEAINTVLTYSIMPMEKDTITGEFTQNIQDKLQLSEKVNYIYSSKSNKNSFITDSFDISFDQQILLEEDYNLLGYHEIEVTAEVLGFDPIYSNPNLLIEVVDELPGNDNFVGAKVGEVTSDQSSSAEPFWTDFIAKKILSKRSTAHLKFTYIGNKDYQGSQVTMCINTEPKVDWLVRRTDLNTGIENVELTNCTYLKKWHQQESVEFFTANTLGGQHEIHDILEVGEYNVTVTITNPLTESLGYEKMIYNQILIIDEAIENLTAFIFTNGQKVSETKFYGAIYNDEKTYLDKCGLEKPDNKSTPICANSTTIKVNSMHNITLNLQVEKGSSLKWALPHDYITDEVQDFVKAIANKKDIHYFIENLNDTKFDYLYKTCGNDDSSRKLYFREYSLMFIVKNRLDTKYCFQVNLEVYNPITSETGHFNLNGNFPVEAPSDKVKIANKKEQLDLWISRDRNDNETEEFCEMGFSSICTIYNIWQDKQKPDSKNTEEISLPLKTFIFYHNDTRLDNSTILKNCQNLVQKYQISTGLTTHFEMLEGNSTNCLTRAPNILGRFIPPIEENKSTDVDIEVNVINEVSHWKSSERFVVLNYDPELGCTYPTIDLSENTKTEFIISKASTISSTVVGHCGEETKKIYEWRCYAKIGSGNKEQKVVYNSAPNGAVVNLFPKINSYSTLNIPKYFFSYIQSQTKTFTTKNYEICLKAYYQAQELSELTTQKCFDFILKDQDIIANLTGGGYRYFAKNDTIMIDASGTFDPDQQTRSIDYVYKWKITKNNNSTKTINQGGPQIYEDTRADDGALFIDKNMDLNVPYQIEVEIDENISGRKYQSLAADGSVNIRESHYFTQTIERLNQDFIPEIQLICKFNCGRTVNGLEGITMESSCFYGGKSCSENQNATIVWEIEKKFKNGDKEIMSLTDFTDLEMRKKSENDTGLYMNEILSLKAVDNQDQLLFKNDLLNEGVTYNIKYMMCISENKVLSGLECIEQFGDSNENQIDAQIIRGLAESSFRLNQPPYNGTCDYDNNVNCGVAGMYPTLINITCQNWVDEGPRNERNLTRDDDLGLTFELWYKEERTNSFVLHSLVNDQSTAFKNLAFPYQKDGIELKIYIKDSKGAHNQTVLTPNNKKMDKITMYSCVERYNYTFAAYEQDKDGEKFCNQIAAGSTGACSISTDLNNKEMRDLRNKKAADMTTAFVSIASVLNEDDDQCRRRRKAAIERNRRTGIDSTNNAQTTSGI